jgi:hypothetical protein
MEFDLIGRNAFVAGFKRGNTRKELRVSGG